MGGKSRFTDRVAVVTGGGSGIGRAICRYLGRRGASVVVGDLNGETAEATAAMISEAGGKAEAYRLNVSVREEVEALIAFTVHRFGRIDYLFNNAGIGMTGEFPDMSEDHWKLIMEVDFWSVIHGCRAVYPVMMQQGFGHIVNTASLAGLIPGGLLSGYTAAKHAVVGFTLCLRAEAKQYGIRVSALCPGYLRTNAQQAGIVVSDYVKADKNVAMEAGMKFLTAEDCIDRIMRGIRKNRTIVFSPNRHRIYWWLHRINPGIIPYMFSLIIRHMKKNAKSTGNVRGADGDRGAL